MRDSAFVKLRHLAFLADDEVVGSCLSARHFEIWSVRNLNEFVLKLSLYLFSSFGEDFGFLFKFGISFLQFVSFVGFALFIKLANFLSE